MKLFEYQAKRLFQSSNIPVPGAQLAHTIDEVVHSAQQIGYPCMLKSQILSGGRGKSKLVVRVHNSDEALAEATRLMKEPLSVTQILVETAVQFSQEIYVAITFDSETGKALLMASVEGGVDIEQLACESPEKIIREYIDLNTGLCAFQIKNVGYQLSLPSEMMREFQKIIMALYEIFRVNDAELVEINPLFISTEGHLIAGDGKISIDDNSLFRHPEFEQRREYYDSDTEFEAAKIGIPYLQFDGDISLMCAGAGLTTTVFDLVSDEGGTIANYLEFGGPNYHRAKEAMQLCLQNDSKVLLIVTFGTIARADVMAEGIIEAVKALQPDRPIITCIRGTNEEHAVNMLREAHLEPIMDTEVAVKKAVEIARRM